MQEDRPSGVAPQTPPRIGLGWSLLLLAALAPGCQPSGRVLRPPRPVVPSRVEEVETRVEVDRATGIRRREWQLLRLPDGSTQKHGFERGWHADGSPAFERAFERGEPCGLWRSWHPGGALRSEYEWAADGSATPMRFWHANGLPSAEGPAARGVREGQWTAWYESGVRREAGWYRGNARHGEWAFYREDGSLRSLGQYSSGRRVGDWQHPPPPLGSRAGDQ